MSAEIVRNWPRQPDVGWVKGTPAWPIPFARISAEALFGPSKRERRVGEILYDGRDEETRQAFWRDSQLYWRWRREYEALDSRLPLIEGTWP